MLNFKERVTQFWEWFSEMESQLAEYVTNIKDYEAEEMTAFFTSGLNHAIEGCAFEMGGKLEVNLSPEGSRAMAFLTSYLVANMPREYAGRWVFTPWKPPMRAAEMGIRGKVISPDDVLVRVYRGKSENEFDLVFYNSELRGMSTEDAYHVFYLVMEMTLGENICMGYIGQVSMAEIREEGMIPLSYLEDYMRETLAAEGVELDVDHNPCLSYSGYGMEATDPDVPRFDIVVGFSRLPAVLHEYYRADTPNLDMLEENGVKVVYLEFERFDFDNHQTDLELRNQIADRLEAEVLGEACSGREIGIILGQAIGVRRCYIDLLLYDEEMFLETVAKVLRDYRIEFNLREFRLGSFALRMAV